ncbi:hypothetical protein AAZX31_02G020600 [Glycine max]|uniref:Uncharacterized protein n=3 Tax=Glycine subgen. Soja TaxID=1462606 RepID=K7K605_SOYBN|nr:uncharacterized protein LOC100812482 isoform X1 [Glycine max]XP_028193622.1 uncharacterized protein LOC114379212 isoform X1 [Glycine soja]KAG5050598.1 hypothetical protein JHK87_002796 [Glycine soja]KAG5078909.1 hypothetical protein JHK86_002974 [Glycine max]KHN08715.1 hypothetical protein glysoja_024624 [Glycine soja]KRH69363.1 hypothetical protein GLYMA_02G021900v4 [Glycine max]RZC23035.1 hypothetical protein D0Y65_002740 [Glycine soja]|eukprot:XP_003519773.1 uncharacterized protein LOC100812482 isoform X1 [Glycine max]
MNFLLRSTTGVYREPSPSIPVPEPRVDTHHRSASAGSSLENRVSDDPYAWYDARVVSGVFLKHVDVAEDEGWVTIPCKELPENWTCAPDIQSLCSLDRSFLFPGERVHILACFSACKQDTSSFKVDAVTSDNGIGHSPKKENGNIENRNNSVSGEGEPGTSDEEQMEDVSDDESLLQKEVLKKQTALLLQKFENSHFFVRISESDDPLWSKRSSSEIFSNSSDANTEKASTIKSKGDTFSPISTIIDRGNFDSNVSGGVARNSVKCCALPNGDLVVVLQVNVGVNFLRDPCIEILQFEKRQERMSSPDSKVDAANQDSCAELLNWMLPLDNGRPSTYPPFPPHLTSTSGIGSSSQGSNFSGSSSSQLFSFGNFRSYSMSSLPQTMSTPSAPVKAVSSKPNFDLKDWDQISSQKYFWKKMGFEGLLSFRGVSLEQERFHVCCGLEGLYTPGRRWRRKLKIIQPLDIHSFAADVNSDDLLCVQIKNVAPIHAPDIVIFIDTITIVLEEFTKNGSLSSLPISCIEAGNDHSLPNLALRRGEEHSFILKPATSIWKGHKIQDDRSSQWSRMKHRNKTSKLRLNRRKTALINDQYSILVSCRCNYTASRLFFKQPTSWRPRSSRDIMISVVSEMSGQSLAAYGKTCQLPIQILTLQASNLTSEDLTLTVLAPASFTSPLSVVSLNSPTTPMSPFLGFSELLVRVNGERGIGATQRQSFTLGVKDNEKQSYDGKAQAVSTSDDVIPGSDLSCTHLWLQSRIPLGCIPSQSIATIKLELLPLTDGIIVLDTLQIDVKEKGVTYIPECSLKIHATSSISKGI